MFQQLADGARLAMSATATLPDLRSQKVVVLDRVLRRSIYERYGRAVSASHGRRRAEIKAERNRVAKHLRHLAHFKALHESAGLPPFAILTEFAASRAFDVIAEYCGAERVYAVWHKFLTVRPQRLSDPEGALPFHQDGYFGQYEPFIRAWIPLAPRSIGDSSPGLQFLPEPGTLNWYPIDEAPTSRDYAGNETSHSVIAELQKARPPFRPIVRTGDAIVFLGDCLHGTYVPPGAIHDRWALEFTFIRASDEVVRGFKRDYCMFGRDTIWWPKDETIVAWYSNPQGTPPADPFLRIDVPNAPKWLPGRWKRKSTS